MSAAIHLLLAIALTGSAELRADVAAELVAAALSQVGVTTIYDGSYRRIPYPGGDVPAERGVCADVIVRAYRGLGVDLQVEVHRDMAKAFSAYPKAWGLRSPDRNIDHRRVLNLAAFLERRGAALPFGRDPSLYRAGDLVTWVLPGNLPHIGIVSDQRVDGRPLIVHNVGAGTVLEDALFEFELTGHYRWLPEPSPSNSSSSVRLRRRPDSAGGTRGHTSFCRKSSRRPARSRSAARYASR